MKQLLVLLLHFSSTLAVLKFASYYADHMVLQRGPQRAIVWGHAATIGDEVTVKVSGKGEVKVKVVKDPNGNEGLWKAKLPAVTDPGPFTLTASSSEGDLTLTDVMFGDVWVCSGQSNMEMPMSQVINSSAEIAESLKFKTIRIIKASMVESPTPLEDLQSLAFQWTDPNEADVSRFSALCMLFGEYIQPNRNYPLGLIDSTYGGTPIEAWSSPDAIAECPTPNNTYLSEEEYLNPDIIYDGSNGPVMPRSPLDKYVLWNAMINPFLDMTIFGALWYQGESNVWYPDLYACQFPAMINDWRKKFHESSEKETDVQFPFGFVQLAPNAKSSEVGDFPAIRWSQTAKFGFAPNEKMSKTFMAVAMDLPDYDSPFGSIHPRYKQDIASRLVLGARSVAYGEEGVKFQGPLPQTFSLNNVNNILNVNYGDNSPIKVLNNNGFEVCCSSTSTTECADSDEWVAAPITDQDTNSASLSVAGCESKSPVGLRYEWRTSPCDLRDCAIYGSDTDLPAPPYITTRGF
ncbi:sialate O-acetylesterase-like [Haliotis rubra]|uniref:sialate O-acetylesterase-like n=1 Tax=Haliotis rubra TaxID=36100 RepID=UPI001EE568BA|nr:sialate O-acetylesterase-like [Haliotis rubra]